VTLTILKNCRIEKSFFAKSSQSRLVRIELEQQFFFQSRVNADKSSQVREPPKINFGGKFKQDGVARGGGAGVCEAVGLTKMFYKVEDAFIEIQNT